MISFIIFDERVDVHTRTLPTLRSKMQPTDDPVVEPSGVKDPTGSVYPQHSLVKPFFARESSPLQLVVQFYFVCLKQSVQHVCCSIVRARNQLTQLFCIACGGPCRTHNNDSWNTADGISIPYWNWIGNTVVTDDYIRLTPDRQTKRGAVWNTIP